MKPAKPKIDRALCRMVTPEFRVSHPHVFNAQAPEGGTNRKFSVTMMFPKGVDLVGYVPTGEAHNWCTKCKEAEGRCECKAPVFVQKKEAPRSIKQIIKNAKIAEFGPKEGWPKGLISHVYDGDDPEKYGDKEGYAGNWIIKATSNEDSRPSVWGPDMKPLVNPNDFYAGCYARASIFARVYKYMNKHGVHFILDHVQKLRDGEPFGGKVTAEQVFGPVGYSGTDEDEPDDMAESDKGF